jgi:RepB DNA-primase from phage plasmid
MNHVEKPAPFTASSSEYILDNFDSADRIAMLVLNRDFGETIQRITSAQKAASTEFQAWLRYKNANGSDIYIGMNPLKKDAATRTKEEIESIKHVYLDLDHGTSQALEAIENSSAVPKPNYVLNSSREKHQVVVWKVEGMNLQEAESLLHGMVREFGGDPAATDATRVLRLPGFQQEIRNQLLCRSPQRVHGNLPSSRLQVALRRPGLAPPQLRKPRQARVAASDTFKPVGTRLGFR